jgi:hypothetical protein
LYDDDLAYGTAIERACCALPAREDDHDSDGVRF